MASLIAAIGRVLLGLVFIVSGSTKLLDTDATEALMLTAGLPANFAGPAGLVELLGGLLIATGLFARLAPLVMIVFTALATLFFHNDITDPAQSAHFFKNLAIIGGLLCAFAAAQARHGYEAARADREEALAERDAALVERNEAEHDLHRPHAGWRRPAVHQRGDWRRRWLPWWN
ncbi:DoxX family protein [Novosphingobium sp. TH158]|uniref:DoxX family protein n=1 Tax=Novosphingobium sp. TH158 TaxID=2067455 RepID=UPI000C7C4E2B|nr:DoxX family protein [Novosphingobium sp. TH158]PLK25949.1 DoxX family protein [Novosphingobium sp. TH158]